MLHCLRLSQEYLSGQVSLTGTELKDLEKKLKKAPDDLKEQLTAFLKHAKEEMKGLTTSLDEVQNKTHAIADYFCEDGKKLKVETLLGEIYTFVSELEEANKVTYTDTQHIHRVVL